MSDEAKQKAIEYFKTLKIDTSTDLSFLPESRYFDEAAKEITFNSIFIHGYTQGREDAMKELEQLQREAFEVGWDKSMLFNDYLSSKSKEVRSE